MQTKTFSNFTSLVGKVGTCIVIIITNYRPNQSSLETTCRTREQQFTNY